MIFSSLSTQTTKLTQSEKEKDDYKVIKDIIEERVLIERGPDEIKNILVNYELFNGNLDPKVYEDPVCFDITTPSGVEEIKFDLQNFTHTPIISNISNSYVGEERNKFFHPTIVDHTPSRNTIKSMAARKVLRKYLTDNIVNPTRQSILQSIMVQNGVTDPFQLAPTPEIQLQLEDQINQLITQELPRDILEFLSNDYQIPTARQAQKMLDFIQEMHSIKWETIHGKKHAVVTGEEYYFAGDYNGDLEFRAIHPLYFIWGTGRRSNEWSQDGDWSKYTDWISYTELVSKHSNSLKKEDLLKLEKEYEPVGFKGRADYEFWGNNQRTEKFMYKYSQDQELQEQFGKVDFNTPEGRKELVRLYGHIYGEDYFPTSNSYETQGIREDHVCIRLNRKFYTFKREQPDGTLKRFWVAEHYTENHKDVDVKEVWKGQVWQSWVLPQNIHAGLGPIPFQYKSLFNPGKVDLPYYGKRYNTNNNTTKNVSLIDLGKKAQKMFDMVLASIKTDMSTNIGPVFMMYLNMKPKDWKYQEWLDLMRNAGLMLVDPKSKAMSNVDPNMIRSVDLSKLGALSGKIQLLEYWKNMIYVSMMFTQDRDVGFGQYANKENVEMSNQRVYNKTGFFDEQHRMIVERALTGFLNRARHYYRENPDEAAVFLDDIELSELKTTPAYAYEHFGVQVKNSDKEKNKLDSIKANILPAIQNQFGITSAFRLILADTEDEIHDLLITEQKEFEKRSQEQFAQQQQLQQQQLQAEAADKQADRQLKYEMHMQDLASKERRAVEEGEKWRKANDVDQNKVSDLLEGTLAKIQADLSMHQDKINLEKEKLKLKEKLSEEPRIN